MFVKLCKMLMSLPIMLGIQTTCTAGYLKHITHRLQQRHKSKYPKVASQNFTIIYRINIRLISPEN